MLRRQEWRRTSLQVRRHSCRRGFDWRGQWCCDAKNGVAPTRLVGEDSCYGGCDGIPVVAGLIGGDGGAATPRMAAHQHGSSAGTVALQQVRQHSCRRGFDWRGQWCCDAKNGVAPTRLVGGDADATTPRMASHLCCSSAGTPTLRMTECLWRLIRRVALGTDSRLTPSKLGMQGRRICEICTGVWNSIRTGGEISRNEVIRR